MKVGTLDFNFILGDSSDGFEPGDWGDLVYTSRGSLWLLCGGLSVRMGPEWEQGESPVRRGGGRPGAR